MLAYRITKYDPAHRFDSAGAYTRNDWTAFSDIGHAFSDGVLTQSGYERGEDAYVATAAAFLQESEVTSI